MDPVPLTGLLCLALIEDAPSPAAKAFDIHGRPPPLSEEKGRECMRRRRGGGKNWEERREGKLHLGCKVNKLINLKISIIEKMILSII